MLYIPGECLFIHIPRTAGNTITRTLTELALHRYPVLTVLPASTRFAELNYGLHRHSTADEVKDRIPDWNDIYKFAVYRNEEDIVASEYKLHLVSEESICPLWNESVRLARQETLEEFKKRRWDEWTQGKSIWQHWCGNYNIHKWDYYTINDHWEKLTRRLELANIPLPYDDWQLKGLA